MGTKEGGLGFREKTRQVQRLRRPPLCPPCLLILLILFLGPKPKVEWVYMYGAGKVNLGIH